MPCPENTTVSGVITEFFKTPDGEIAFARVNDYGTVTIALNTTCREEITGPAKKEKVVIVGLTMYEQRWCAYKARRYTLEDQQNGL